VGDQVGTAVGGTLYYVPAEELQRVRESGIPAVDRAGLFAAMCRINALYMIARAGSGHIGSSFSSMDIMSWLHLSELRAPAGSREELGGDVFFSSKGHDAPALYCTLIGMERMDFDLIHRLRRLGGLPGHPDINTPAMVTNTGSLGMGVSKAKGMIFANRLLKREGRVYVLTGDGELQEGQFWESLLSAANHRLHELTVIIDHNKLQSDTLVSKVSDLGDLEAKLRAFGWHVGRCDGNDMAALSATLAVAAEVNDRPKVIIADTIKGKGVSFMEHTSIDSDVELYKFHSGAPNEDAYMRAAQELITSVNRQAEALGVGPVALESITRPSAAPAGNPQRLVAAYSDALLEQARKNGRLVALDADLILDTGLIPFQKEFPERFLECGIAEQDMVSQAGGMALAGLVPVVHSFACFLSARPNEQIYNNATEGKKIIYVGSLAGMIPGGPGHSHQATRDISSLAAVPGLTLVEPSLGDEVAPLLDWCLNENAGSSYLRLVSVPVEFPAIDPEPFRVRPGYGRRLKPGRGIAFLGYGPVLLAEAVRASDLLDGEGSTVGVYSFPWLNRVDPAWLRAMAAEYSTLVVIDNHYAIGGLFDRFAVTLVQNPEIGLRLAPVALDRIPECGTNAEILNAHGMSAEALASVVRALKN
jgi:transketolase